MTWAVISGKGVGIVRKTDNKIGSQRRDGGFVSLGFLLLLAGLALVGVVVFRVLRGGGELPIGGAIPQDVSIGVRAFENIVVLNPTEDEYGDPASSDGCMNGGVQGFSNPDSSGTVLFSPNQHPSGQLMAPRVVGRAWQLLRDDKTRYVSGNKGARGSNVAEKKSRLGSFANPQRQRRLQERQFGSLGESERILCHLGALACSVRSHARVDHAKNHPSNLQESNKHEIPVKAEHLRLYLHLALALPFVLCEFAGSFLWVHHRDRRWHGWLLCGLGSAGLLSVGGSYVFGSAALFWRFGWL